ncbi:MAG: YggU family protein [Deltaproteobacteria bacterium]|nr:YggU family protein [Deltaproteobacteria bacterium]
MTIEVQILPKSVRDEILGFVSGRLRVRVSAPPMEGKANESLIKLISRTIEVPRPNVAIIKGKTSRIKVIKIEGVSQTKFNWFKKTYSN